MPLFYTVDETPTRPEAERRAYFVSGAGLLFLTLVEYVVLRMTGKLPEPKQVVEYKRAFPVGVRQAEFTVWTKAQEAAQTIPKPAPKPKPPERKMPHRQSTQNYPFQSGANGSLGGFGNHFSSHEDT